MYVTKASSTHGDYYSALASFFLGLLSNQSVFRKSFQPRKHVTTELLDAVDAVDMVRELRQLIFDDGVSNGGPSTSIMEHRVVKAQ